MRAVEFAAAIGLVAPAWQAPLSVADSTPVPVRVRVVGYGDGVKDDALGFVPFDLSRPTIPCPGNPQHWDWDQEGTSHRIYISRLGHLCDASLSCIGERGGPDQDHSILADDLNMLGWDPRAPGTGSTRQWGLWL